MVADLGPGSTASALVLCMTDCPDSAASFPACRGSCSVGPEVTSRLREVHIPSAGTAERGASLAQTIPQCPALPPAPH